MRELLRIICLLSLVIGSDALATSFAPVSVRRKIADSDAIVFGSVQRKYYAKDERGRIVTVVVLSVTRSLGLKFENIKSRDNFSVQYLGGVWEGMVRRIEGSPNFVEGESVVVLIKKVSKSYWIHNLAAGKFTQVKKSGQTFFQSSVFSEELGVGLISQEQLDQALAESHLRSSFYYRPSEKNIAQEKNRGLESSAKRGLATIGNKSSLNYPERGEGNSSHRKKLNPVVFILLVPMLGFVFIFIARRKKNLSQQQRKS